MSSSLPKGMSVLNVFAEFRDAAQAMGVSHCACFLMPPGISVGARETSILFWGFTPFWTSLLNDERVGAVRFVEKLLDDGLPKSWADAAMQEPRNGRLWQQIDGFVRAAELSGFILPTYGPHAYQCLFSFAVPRRTTTGHDAWFARFQQLADKSSRLLAIAKYRELQNQLALSDREKAVLQQMAYGKSKVAAAALLGISVASVDTYLRRVYVKLGTHDRVDAVLRAVAFGIIKL